MITELSKTKVFAFQKFVEVQHGEQKRKYTNEPYFNHCVNVANIVFQAGYVDPVMLCVALGHDLLEDTKVSLGQIKKFCESNGFDEDEIDDIIIGIVKLTNKFTSTEYPHLNRSQRLDSYLDWFGSRAEYGWIETIKYADIIDNCDSIKMHDPDFAKVYLPERLRILFAFDHGDSNLKDKAYQVCKS